MIHISFIITNRLYSSTDFRASWHICSPDGNFCRFLDDKRRMNVALTRAKCALYVIGRLSSLQVGILGKPDILSV